MKSKLTIILSLFLVMYSCESNDDVVDDGSGGDSVVNFEIEKLEVLSLGNSDQSQPELVRFVSETEGVVVNSKQNTIDF